jgi:hypothetical protein
VRSVAPCRAARSRERSRHTQTVAGTRRRPRRLTGTELFGQLARESEVVAARVRLIENVKVLASEADATKAVRTPRARDALYEIGTRRAALTLDAMLTSNERLAISAMRAIRAVQATYTVVTANQPFRIVAERTVVAALARVAGHTPRVGRALAHLSYELAESRLELSCTQLFRGAAHRNLSLAKRESSAVSPLQHDG